MFWYIEMFLTFAWRLVAILVILHFMFKMF